MIRTDVANHQTVSSPCRFFRAVSSAAVVHSYCPDLNWEHIMACGRYLLNSIVAITSDDANGPSSQR